MSLTVSNRTARAIVGLGALTEMFSLIGKPGATDHDMAQVVTDYELELRALAEAFAENLSLQAPV